MEVNKLTVSYIKQVIKIMNKYSIRKLSIMVKLNDGCTLSQVHILLQNQNIILYLRDEVGVTQQGQVQGRRIRGNIIVTKREDIDDLVKEFKDSQMYMLKIVPEVGKGLV